MRFTTLLHHVDHIDHLREATDALKREAARGIDGETWQHYGEALEENLRDLSGRLARGRIERSGQAGVLAKADGGNGWVSRRWKTSSSSARRSRC